MVDSGDWKEAIKIVDAILAVSGDHPRGGVRNKECRLAGTTYAV